MEALTMSALAWNVCRGQPNHFKPRRDDEPPQVIVTAQTKAQNCTRYQ